MKTTKAMQRKFDRIQRRHDDKDWADAAKARDGHKCWMCDKNSESGDRLNSHHILPKENYPEYRHEPWNSATLCFRHHTVDKLSPHKDAIGFAEWVKKNKPEVYTEILNALAFSGRAKDKKWE